MKTKIRHISFIIMFILLTTTAQVYTQTPGKGQQESVTQNNADAQNSNIPYYAKKISWWDSGNGFIRKTSVDNMSYITRYDKQGKYVETLKQKDWNDSSALLSSFRHSPYNQQTITGYWEVSDTNKKGYYLEMHDDKNHFSCVWVDDKGNFSIIPATKSKQ